VPSEHQAQTLIQSHLRHPAPPGSQSRRFFVLGYQSGPTKCVDRSETLVKLQGRPRMILTSWAINVQRQPMFSMEFPDNDPQEHGVMDRRKSLPHLGFRGSLAVKNCYRAQACGGSCRRMIRRSASTIVSPRLQHHSLWPSKPSDVAGQGGIPYPPDIGLHNGDRLFRGRTA
jgi:hypothetical protein